MVATRVRCRAQGLVLAGTVALFGGGEAASAASPKDVALGLQIVQGAGVAAEHACERCHGLLGMGRPSEEAPRLAGQARFYLHKQLEDFAAGLRPSEKMEPVARSLSEEQRRAVAAYFSSLEWVPYPPQPEADPLVVQRGGVLSSIGDTGRKIRACEICHADAGVGLPPSFPYLAGQHGDYTARQLRLWKRGLRRNDPLDVMAEIAEALSQEEIEALALYFSRVRPPVAAVSSLIPEEPVPPPPDSPSLPD